MVMDMGRDAEQETVELTYQPTAADFAQVLRERRRFSRAGRRFNWVIGAMFCLAAVEAVVWLAGGKPDMFLMMWSGLTAVVFLFLPRLQARTVQRVAARNGVFRAVVTDAGVTVTTDAGSSTIYWSGQPRYRESAQLFTLYSDDKNATCFTLLPKRGLSGPADADRLRAILDRHLTRV
ncbi:YcxB family protein [Streptomyces sp. NPDC059766]|uniref:YcxB family protein n=1 Tax=Streptomyces sp. NPDC059766 TaxID=3346940 RepID=UPI00365B0554